MLTIHTNFNIYIKHTYMDYLQKVISKKLLKKLFKILTFKIHNFVEKLQKFITAI